MTRVLVVTHVRVVTRVRVVAGVKVVVGGPVMTGVADESSMVAVSSGCTVIGRFAEMFDPRLGQGVT